ncbi:hypothetical protein RMATCC62417_15241 [Rhizopus microsporus]|nr:hypothetical protein RMATCC62417_15241 [Rhizopus microsporus]
MDQDTLSSLTTQHFYYYHNYSTRKYNKFRFYFIQWLYKLKRDTKNCPRLLDQYGTLQKKVIGTGASATIKVIKDKKSVFAVKVFQKGQKQKKWMSEYCISSVLSHPNIIKTMDLVLDQHHRHCIIMEYCSEGDLYSFIKDGRLVELKEINYYFKQLLDGLSYLHSIGVAHRDIKPENLLIQDGVLKITDFGEATVFKQISNLITSDGLCGSIPYMAPEVFHQQYDPSQADVWSAAIVYFCMRLKGVPFFSATMSDPNYRLYQRDYTKKQYPAFDVLDNQTQDLLYSMLNPNPKNRFTIQNVLDLPWIADV